MTEWMTIKTSGQNRLSFRSWDSVTSRNSDTHIHTLIHNTHTMHVHMHRYNLYPIHTLHTLKYTHTNIHTYTLTHNLIPICIHTLTHGHTCTQLYYAHTHTQDTHIYTYTYTHTLIHLYTYSQMNNIHVTLYNTHAFVRIRMTNTYTWKGSNETPQDVPPWHMVYFDLKIIKTPQIQEKFLPLL